MMNKSKFDLKPGNRCFFYGGVTGLIMSYNGKDSFCIEVEQAYDESFESNIGKVVSVSIKECEPLVSEMFDINDEIVSVICQHKEPLHGTIVGFEYDLNKVVVRSAKLDKYDNKRTRYAYGPGEVVKEDSITFVPGRYYHVFVNDVPQKLKCVVNDDTSVCLIDLVKHKVVFATLPMTCSSVILKGLHNISSVLVA